MGGTPGDYPGVVGDVGHGVLDRRGQRIEIAGQADLFQRSVFVIGPDHKVKLTLTYPASTGRNFQELLRVIDSLQLTAAHAVATPADGKPGEPVIIVPAVSDEEARTRFPGGFTAKKPYLRVTAQP